MRRIQATRREVPKDWARVRPAAPEDASIEVSEPAVVYEGDKPILIHQVVSDDLNPLLRACQKIRYNEDYRTSGLKSTSRIFGYQARIGIRRDFCSVASLDQEDPDAHGILMRLAGDAARHFVAEAPGPATEQRELLSSKVKPEWVMPGGAFTSGIVNWNNQLAYHHDAGNFLHSWSAMYVLKRDIKGGDLVVPELDLRFKFQTGSLLLFDGGSLLHGVTPMKQLSLKGYRFTVVYYALKGMCNCLSRDGELQRIRDLKTKREQKRAAGEAGFQSKFKGNAADGLPRGKRRRPTP